MLGPALAILFGIGWIPLFVYRAEAMRDPLPYYTPAQRRCVQLAPAIVAVHTTLACALLSRSAPPPWRAALGVLLFAAAVGFWTWARAQIGSMRVTRLPDEPPAVLRRSGPFGVVRNPLYLGYLGAAAAPALVAARPVLALTFAACVAALAIRAAQEERRLHAQLGSEYAEYCRKVPRLIPFVW
jgi:protein-S-isoprenylcysteine O-methyltransferase Ste14